MFIAAAIAISAQAAFADVEVILPQGRAAYYASEAFEMAFAGVADGVPVNVELAPDDARLTPLKFTVVGDGSTAVMRVPAGALAPGVYTVRAAGKPASVNVTIASGVLDSTTLLSQTCSPDKVRSGGGNFIVGNYLTFSVLDENGLPAREPRTRCEALALYDKAVGLNLPTLGYWYWSGYVLHKPWGNRKTWESTGLQEMMRMHSLHAGQWFRRVAPNLLCVGTLDEPGLNWGRTPAGGWASGFPNWDARPWYEARGWEFTDDPAARNDADWLRYLTIRCDVIGENMLQARRDLMAAWPDARFSTDIYAAHVVMDGTDAMNQACNGETPTTHVFVDWGVGRDCTGTEICIEKASNPVANVAHAMNGRLMGGKVPMPQHADCYRLSLNAMLQAGLESNWWLNWGEMKLEDLAPIHQPVRRLGPFLKEMGSANHDVAVLWGFTELCMRQKAHALKEAARKAGEQIQLMIAALPENTAFKEKQVQMSSYVISGNYRNAIAHAHSALLRAGYPAHVVHERLLPTGILRNYKTLVLVGQTFDFPPESRAALDDFVAGGGKIVTDASATVKLDGAIEAAASFKDPMLRWSPLFNESVSSPKSFKTAKEASYYQTNAFMSEPILKAVPTMKAAMRQTDSRPAAGSEASDLVIERRTGGEGSVIMVLNAHQELPQIADDQPYLVWNYAPCKARLSLMGLEQGSVVYAIEGTDWRQTMQLPDPAAPIDASFAAGEMKLYIVAPREPNALQVSLRSTGTAIQVSVQGDIKMPWPVTVSVAGPDAAELCKVHRSLDCAGELIESFPIGSNAPPGKYAVEVSSPVGYGEALMETDVKPGAGGFPGMIAAGGARVPAGSGNVANAVVQMEGGAGAITMRIEARSDGSVVREVFGGTRPAQIREKVRVFDEDAIRRFLALHPALTVAYGSPDHKPMAEDLAQALLAKGIPVSVAHEKAVFERARYPRVWDPFIKLYKPEGEERNPSGTIGIEVRLETAEDGRVAAFTADGTDVGNDWQKPGTLATVAGKGFIAPGDKSGEDFFEPGCKLYVNEKKSIEIIKGAKTEQKATDDVRLAWPRPWQRLTTTWASWILPPKLPEAYRADRHLILIGDSQKSELVAALQASGLLQQVVDSRYPGPGKCLVSLAWSPFALEKNVILVGAADDVGAYAGIDKLVEMVK